MYQSHSPRARLVGELRRFALAEVSACAATALDFALAWMLAACGVWYVAATALGAVAGGVANCVANARWVFQSAGRAPCAIAVRYAAVWAASIALNTAGTWAATELSAAHFLLCKAAVAVCVAVAWNYPLQRRWVFNTKTR